MYRVEIDGQTFTTDHSASAGLMVVQSFVGEPITGTGDIPDDYVGSLIDYANALTDMAEGEAAKGAGYTITKV